MPEHKRPIVADAEFPDSFGVCIVYDGRASSPLYVGKAATQSIKRRWKRQHRRPRSGGSALRRSLGIYLQLVKEKLKRPQRYYPEEVEAAITVFLEACSIEFVSAPTAERASELEQELIRTLAPRLNITYVK